jgi:hypothetical protein
MIFTLLQGFVSLVLDVLATVGVAADEKGLEFALLSQQLRNLERKRRGKNRLAPPEKLRLVVLADKLKVEGHAVHDRLRVCLVLVQPETLLNGIGLWCMASGPSTSLTRPDDRSSIPSWKR